MRHGVLGQYPVLVCNLGTVKEHIQHVKAVLEKLHQLYAKLEKCTFHVTEVEFLGFILTPQGVQMDNRKVEEILQWLSSTSVKAVQSFLGFANFYQRFISDFSDIVHLITSLLRKYKIFMWSMEAEQAFTRLKHQFTSAAVL
ncbi:uncharacterized protein [Ambystoma mexicanum]|uniref:uncharacterized protein n=1 Tax=Ambystoma mexicanum TaxID=8296 RepID=UPI0037E7265F